MNILADYLSRYRIRQTEWMLNISVGRNFFQVMGHPLIDMFASIHNRQRFLHIISTALSMCTRCSVCQLEGMFLNAYPPICDTKKSYSNETRFNCQVILITALWPRRPPYTDLLQLAIAIPNIQIVLQQPNTEIYNPNLEALQLTACLLSTEDSKKWLF